VGPAVFLPGSKGRSTKTFQLTNTYNVNTNVWLKVPLSLVWGANVGFEPDFLPMNRLFTHASLDLGAVDFEGDFTLGCLTLTLRLQVSDFPL
jgi:hypothetical protein